MYEHMGVHWADCEFVVIDVEGNGQTPQEIVEVAAVNVQRGKLVPHLKEWMVLPTRPVTQRASRLHGITNADLTGKPTFDQISAELLSVLGERVIVGHNISVDTRLLKDKLPHWHPSLSLDTLKLARWTLPRARSYALHSLVADRTIKLGNAPLHRAAGDAFVTAQLFLDLVRELDRDGGLSLRRLAEIAGLATDLAYSNSQQTLF